MKRSLQENCSYVLYVEKEVNQRYILVRNICDEIHCPVRLTQWIRPVDRLWNALLKLHVAKRIIRRLRKILTGRMQNKFQTIWTIHFFLNPLIFNHYYTVFSLALNKTDFSCIHSQWNSQFPASFFGTGPSCPRINIVLCKRFTSNIMPQAFPCRHPWQVMLFQSENKKGL